MMGKTHVSVGIAAALLLAEPGNPTACLVAVAGGALGGVAPDMDILDNENRVDARVGHLLAATLLAFLLVLDWQNGFPVSASILARGGTLAAGLALYAGLSVLGVLAEHRGFTHSILALFLFTRAAELVYAPLGGYYLAGYLSHLLLDFLNRQGIRLFFPLRARLCLHLCYADGLGNRICMLLGLAASAALLFLKLYLWKG